MAMPALLTPHGKPRRRCVWETRPNEINHTIFAQLGDEDTNLYQTYDVKVPNHLETTLDSFLTTTVASPYTTSGNTMYNRVAVAHE